MQSRPLFWCTALAAGCLLFAGCNSDDHSKDAHEYAESVRGLPGVKHVDNHYKGESLKLPEMQTITVTPTRNATPREMCDVIAPYLDAVPKGELHAERTDLRTSSNSDVNGEQDHSWEFSIDGDVTDIDAAVGDCRATLRLVDRLPRRTNTQVDISHDGTWLTVDASDSLLSEEQVTRRVHRLLGDRAERFDVTIR